MSGGGAVSRERWLGLLVALLAGAFALRVWHLDAQSLWWDEMVTITDPHGFPAQRNRMLAEGAKFDGLKNWLDARYPVVQSLDFPGIVLTCYHQAEETPDG